MNSYIETSNQEPNYSGVLISGHENDGPESTIRDPVVSQTKGRQKDDFRVSQSKRIKSSLELSMNRLLKKQRLCQLCGEHDHNRRSCKPKISQDVANLPT